ncbi:MAG: enoyl-CoA hydratase-related protein [Pseudomonadota bacterium]
MSDDEPVKFSVDEDGIASVVIDRPHSKNALSIAASEGLVSAWEKIEASPEIRVAILTSTDCGVFCAGMDLKEAAKIKESEGVDILTKMPDPRLEVMRSVSKPIIAAMTGSLMAGGMMLALNCDLRVGLHGTKAGITEVNVGRGSPWSAPALWMMPQPVLMEMVLTGSLFPIEKLHEYGFTNYLEETPDKVRDRAYTLAKQVIAGAPLSVAAAKASIRAVMNEGLESGMEKAWEVHKGVYASEDAIEGPRAFAEKRQPEWKGR